MRISALFGLLILFSTMACKEDNSIERKLATEAQTVRDQVPVPAVIAHRGLPYFAPEETEAAYLLARDLGADYLEADLQRTKDGVIVAFHDDDLKRTTNVEDVFPQRADEAISSFTLEELKRLDAGSWFNKAYPERARSTYAGLQILTLEELIDIAESGTNRPGLYLETKEPQMYPGIEKDLYDLLLRRGWVSDKDEDTIATASVDGLVLEDDFVRLDVGLSKGRVVLQTFSRESLRELNQYFPQTPTALLLWKDDLKDGSPETFGEWLDYGIQNGAEFIGPSIPGAPNNYSNLMEEWMVEMIHEKGLYVHPYTFNTSEDFEKFAVKTEGQFTDRTDLLLDYYGRPRPQVEEIMKKYHF